MLEHDSFPHLNEADLIRSIESGESDGSQEQELTRRLGEIGLAWTDFFQADPEAPEVPKLIVIALLPENVKKYVMEEGDK